MNADANIKSILASLSEEQWFCDIIAKANKKGKNQMIPAGFLFGIPIFIENEENLSEFITKSRAFFCNQYLSPNLITKK